VPLSAVRTNPEHLAMLEQWLRSYRPEELFDGDGAPVEAICVLEFTGGVGERAAPVRRLVAARLGFLGVRVDDHANDSADGGTDTDIGAGDARVLVVRAREDVEIARQVRQVLGG